MTYPPQVSAAHPLDIESIWSVFRPGLMYWQVPVVCFSLPGTYVGKTTPDNQFGGNDDKSRTRCSMYDRCQPFTQHGAVQGSSRQYLIFPKGDGHDRVVGGVSLMPAGSSLTCAGTPWVHSVGTSCAVLLPLTLTSDVPGERLETSCRHPSIAEIHVRDCVRVYRRKARRRRRKGRLA